MTVERVPLGAWRYPRSTQLENRAFPSGRPPFGPFPTITNLVNASLCPVAAYHDLLHGDDSALMGRFPLSGRGELFHRFVANLKTAIAHDRLQLAGRPRPAQLDLVHGFFLDYARRQRTGSNEAGGVWRTIVEPWVGRHLEHGSLAEITREDRIYFEIDLAAVRVPVALNGASKSYPLRGRIDEIDVGRRRLIERTSRPSVGGASPLLKDFQCWLLWRCLTAIPRAGLPEAWREEDFSQYNLFVETPDATIEVQKENQQFEMDTHWAYSWLHDISIEETPGVAAEVFQNARCSPQNPLLECSHAFLTCFGKTMPYPQARPEMRRVFQPWYRLILWDRMWEGDLVLYQQLSLSREQLLDQGLVSEARIIQVDQDATVLELVGGARVSLRGYDEYTLIPFGTLACGKRVRAALRQIDGNRITMEVRDPDWIPGNRVLVLPAPLEPVAQMVQMPPSHLKLQSQRSLFKVQRAGVIKPERASQNSLVQLLETLFGIRQMRRGKQ